MEVDFYKIMKKESGSTYVKKIENMIHDILYSQTINFDFKLYNKKNNTELGIDFYIKVVSQDNWPLEKHLILNFNSEQNKNKELNSENLKIKGMPESISKCIKEFTKRNTEKTLDGRRNQCKSCVSKRNSKQYICEYCGKEFEKISDNDKLKHKK